MGHHHGHGHNHSHSHTHSGNKRTLFIAFLLIAGFMAVEAVGGWITNSLALLADAGHMLSDAISLGVGVMAFSLGEKAANFSKTYGYKRIEILAAVFNGVTLLLIALFICYEAIERLANPPEVASGGMLAIAGIGLLVNVLAAWILMRGGDTEHNLNMRAAFLHVIGDMLGSIGAIIAALLIMGFGWNWADPLASIAAAILVLISGWRVSRDAVHVLMEGTPKEIDIDQVIRTMRSIPGVLSIHDLHVWSITSGQNALSCHVVVADELSVRESQSLLRSIEHELLHLGIGHATIQLEVEDHPHAETLICRNES